MYLEGKLPKLTTAIPGLGGRFARCMFPRPTGACQPYEGGDEHCMDCFQMATCNIDGLINFVD